MRSDTSHHHTCTHLVHLSFLQLGVASAVHSLFHCICGQLDGSIPLLGSARRQCLLHLYKRCTVTSFAVT